MITTIINDRLVNLEEDTRYLLNDLLGLILCLPSIELLSDLGSR